ncbi:ABC transporter permease [Rossellomorea vietnamensis]|uniref:ABC transporter permease n=1 Tax=Rossellomorea vietnamensis TaxID=218284 RepID=A0A5D4NTH3_9BACI|nr:ABC transporter permease [Rossellomorea vietnamensis]TYS17507.1 ABC transporter permease [Rossellomorea vietnamensis]
MMKYIMGSWKRNRERLILLIIGVMVISGGLSYLFNLTESSKGTVVENLQKSWVSSYDIVVKPTDSVNSNLLEPNYLNGITGGISIDQYETIKKIEGVEVAAPISVIGYSELGVTFEELFNEKLARGIYRVHVNESGNNGLEDTKLKDYSFYFSEGAEIKEKIPGVLGPDQFDKKLSITQLQLLVGIDPEQEAKLVGLDKAIEGFGDSRYFDSSKDKVNKLEPVNSFEIPVLINNHSFSQTVHNFRLEKLNFDFSDETKQRQTLNSISTNGGLEYLDSLPKGEEVNSIRLSSKELEKSYFYSLTGVETGQQGENFRVNGEARNSSMVVYKSSPLQYKKLKSPFPERWSHAFSAEQTSIQLEKPFDSNVPAQGYRDLQLVDPVVERKDNELPVLPVVTYKVIGFYNPNNITASKDPLNELPLETYRPPQAKMVLDEKEEPINPPSDVTGIGNPTGLLTNPPNIITTLDSAEMITGGDSISSIRIIVNGVEGIGEESQKRVESIAKEIKDKTGLNAVVTLGSSPQPTITRVQTEAKTLGWVEQPWINIGNAITIFRETSLGYSGVMISLLLVAVVYVFSTSLVSFLSRRKEFSVLLSLGWENNHIRRILMMEAALQWVLVILFSCIIQSIIYTQTGEFSFINIVYVSTFALLVYVLSLLPLAVLVSKITPYEAMRTGEISRLGKRLVKTKGIVGLATNNIVSKWKRNLLSLLVIAMPTALFTFYLFVTFRLQGVLYTSWLGEYVALSIDNTHYITLGIAFGLSILTTAEIMWQNISERKNEIGVLQAIGWGRAAVRFIIIMEGALIGFIAGLAGVSISFAVIGAIYGVFPTDSLLLISSTIIVPVFIGILGSLLPSEIGVRTKPINAMKAS